MQQQKTIATIDDCFNELCSGSMLDHALNSFLRGHASSPHLSKYANVFHEAYAYGLQESLYGELDHADQRPSPIIMSIYILRMQEIPITVELLRTIAILYDVGLSVGAAIHREATLRTKLNELCTEKPLDVFLKPQDQEFDATLKKLEVIETAQLYALHHEALFRKYLQQTFQDSSSIRPPQRLYILPQASVYM